MRPKVCRVAALLAAGIGLSAAASFASAQAGSVRTGEFWSQALGIKKRYVVYLPPSYARDQQRRYPVAYYLHGWDGDETNWTKLAQIDHTLDSLIASGMPELIVVMPDGDDSWYTTWNFLGDYPGCLRQPPRRTEPAATYCVPWPHYDDYIARDLVAHVDSTFRTEAARARRGIAGLSMGGYGAVSLALAYPDVFAAAASHSGVVAPLLVAYDRATKRARYADDLQQLKPFYGGIWPSLQSAFGRDTAGWWARDPSRRAHQARTVRPQPAIYIDVGVKDRFLDQSRAFRDVLADLELRPAYFEREGVHDWAYWRANVPYSLKFLATYLSGP